MRGQLGGGEATVFLDNVRARAEGQKAPKGEDAFFGRDEDDFFGNSLPTSRGDQAFLKSIFGDTVGQGGIQGQVCVRLYIRGEGCIEYSNEMNMYMFMCTYIYTYMYIYIHTYIYTYNTYIYMYVHMRLSTGHPGLSHVTSHLA